MSEFFTIGIKTKAADFDIDRDIIARLKEAQLIDGYIDDEDHEGRIPQRWFRVDGQEAFVIDYTDVDESDREEEAGEISDVTFDLNDSGEARKSRQMILAIGDLLSEVGDLVISDGDFVIARSNDGGAIEEFAVGRGFAGRATETDGPGL